MNNINTIVMAERIKKVGFALALVIGVSLAGSANALKIGMSTVLDGPAKGLGQNVRLGVEAYFNKVNMAGGVNGEKLELIALDDGYEPHRAAVNMRKLIDEEKVMAVIGNVGTPTAIVTVPIANKTQTLLFGSVTGAGVLRKTPPDRYVINYRASYEEETSAMVGGLLDAGIKPEEIAFFTQKDGYGDAGYEGGIKALRAKGFTQTDALAHGRYQRNTVNVEDGLGVILDAKVDPKAIIMVGAYKPCAEFIKLAKEDFPDALFLNVSFVGSIPLLRELGGKTENVIVTQVVPHYNADLPGVEEFRDSLQTYQPGAKPSFMSLEGYIAAKVFVEGIKAAGANLTRESIVDGLLSLRNLDVGIVKKLSFTETNYQASHNVWPTWIKNGKYVPLKWSELKP